MIRRSKLLVFTLLAMARYKPWEPALIIIALLIATGGLSSVWMINEGARQGDMASAAPALFSGARIIARDSASPVTQSDYVSLRRQGFTELVAISDDQRSLRCSNTAHGSSQDVSTKIHVLGIDLLALPGLLSGPKRAQTRTTGEAGFVASFAAPQLVANLNCQTHLLRQSGRPMSLPQPLNGLPEDTLVIALSGFYTNTVTPETLPLSALITMAPLSEIQQRRLTTSLPDHLKYEPASQLISKGNLSESFRLNLWAMGALMAVVALFIVLNAMMLMYRSRLPVVIRMRQMGVSARLLQAGLLAELAIYCLVSTPVGVAVGLILTRQLTPILQQTFASLFDTAFISPSPFLAQTMLAAFAIAFSALTIFSLVTGRQLVSAVSVSSVRKKNWSLSTRVVLSSVSVVAATLFTGFADTTLLALLSVAAVLLCGCLLIVLWLPSITRLLRYFTPPARPLIGYIIASTSALSGKTRLAICAFFIALSANIGMNVMTDSFRQATEDWLSQRLSAPAYLYTEQPLADIQRQNVRAKPVYSGSSSFNEANVAIRSFPTDEQARQSLMLDQVIAQNPDLAWQQFSTGTGVFINQQFAFRHDVQVGQQITLGPVFTQHNTRSPAQSHQIMTVTGIYPDYGNPDAQALLPLQRFSPTSGFAGVVALYPPAGENLDSVKRLGDVYISEELIDLSMQTFDRTFIVTDALNVATLLVAGLSFAISISVLMLDIKPQLSVLRGMGVHQWQIKLALLSQYMLFCLITALLALPFGLLLTWVFINRVNRYAFYWEYPMDISFPVLLQSVVVSLVVVLIVLLLPLGRIDPKVDLRQEATF